MAWISLRCTSQLTVLDDAAAVRNGRTVHGRADGTVGTVGGPKSEHGDLSVGARPIRGR